MVMAGRQLEKVKHEKKAMKKKIRALQKEASEHNNSTSKEQQKDSRPLLSAPTFVQQEDNDWSKDVRKELSSILEGIPTTKDKPTDNKGLLGSIWNFGNVLNSVFAGSSTTRRRRRRRGVGEPQCRQPDSTDYIFMGLSFIDFWLTATSTDIFDQGELNHEICQLGRENNWLTENQPLFDKMERVLIQGVGLYLQNYYGEEDYVADNLLTASNFGKQNGDCNHIVINHH